MADSNNHLTAQLSAEPYPQLRTLDRLVGQWQTTRTVPPWRHELRMDGGGFFLIQHVDANAGGRQIKGTEYIGYDEQPDGALALHGRPRRQLHLHLGTRRRHDQDLVRREKLGHVFEPTSAKTGTPTPAHGNGPLHRHAHAHSRHSRVDPVTGKPGTRERTMS
jgi:hypothetical protein